MKYVTAAILAVALLAGAPAASASDAPGRVQATSEFRKAFDRGDFADIEARYTQDVASGRRLPEGLLWADHMVWAMFDKPPAQGIRGVNNVRAPEKGDDAYWLPIEQKIEAWLAQHPKSALPAIAQARAYVGHGFDYRGGSYARYVSEADMSKFRDYVAKAHAALMSRKAVGEKDPNWWATLLYVNNYTRMPTREYMALTKSAMDRFPGHYDIHFAALGRLLPQWGGSMEAVEWLAREGTERTRKTEGHAVYARVYWAAHDALDPKIWREPGTPWPRVKAGFEDMVARYPDPRNYNVFAKLACWSNDKPAAAKAMAVIKDKPEPEVWEGRSAFQQCRRFATE